MHIVDPVSKELWEKSRMPDASAAGRGAERGVWGGGGTPAEALGVSGCLAMAIGR